MASVVPHNLVFGGNLMKAFLMLVAAALTQLAQAQAPTAPGLEEKVFECIGEYTTGKKGPFREMVTVKGNTARIADIQMTLTGDNSPDYFNYLNGSNYQLTLFRNTGRFKYSTFLRKLLVVEGDCKKVERSKVFE
jgi:hypothetical protein